MWKIEQDKENEIVVLSIEGIKFPLSVSQTKKLAGRLIWFSRLAYLNHSDSFDTEFFMITTKIGLVTLRLGQSEFVFSHKQAKKLGEELGFNSVDIYKRLEL